jgi:hypothetical protein
LFEIALGSHKKQEGTKLAGYRLKEKPNIVNAINDQVKDEKISLKSRRQFVYWSAFCNTDSTVVGFGVFLSDI